MGLQEATGHLLDLKERLAMMKAAHWSYAQFYGSELSAGDLKTKELALEQEIEKASKLVEDLAGKTAPTPQSSVTDQPLVKDPHGVVRFKSNPIVCWLLDMGSKHGLDMNAIAMLPGISDEDRAQFAQLIGYSVCGYCDLSYVPDAMKDRAWDKMEDMVEEGHEDESH